MATAAPMDPMEHTLPVSVIRPSPKNPRTITDESVRELADDIKRRGIMQPIRVRPVFAAEGEATEPGVSRVVEHYEIVYGHRRHAAAIVAGIAEVPVRVTQMTDREADEARAAENEHRQELNPIERAHQFRDLLASAEAGETGYADVARRASKPLHYVARYVKLLDLPDVYQRKVAAGACPVSTALLVARVEPGDLREKAAQEIIGADPNVEPLSYADAVKRAETYRLALGGAPFNITAEDLVPAAGACGTCPKRTGNQADLFGVAEDASVCLDRKCFESKVEAAWSIACREAEKRGIRVLTPEETEKAFLGGVALDPDPRSGLVALDAKVWTDEKNRTWRTLLGRGKENRPGHALARVGFRFVEMVDKDAALRLLAPKHEWAAAEAPPEEAAGEDAGGSPKADDPKAKARARIKELREEHAALVTHITSAVASDNTRFDQMSYWLAVEVARTVWEQVANAVCKRRGWMVERNELAWRSIERHIGKLSGDDALAVAVELLLCRYKPAGEDTTLADPLKQAAAVFEVDMKALRTTVRDARKKKSGGRGRFRTGPAAPAAAAPAAPATASPAPEASTEAAGATDAPAPQPDAAAPSGGEEPDPFGES